MQVVFSLQGQNEAATSFLLRHRAASSRRRVDRVTAEVARAFGARGVRSLLLKGPTVTRWLYPADSARDYVDTDLLVSREQLRSAELCLRALGFESALDESDVAATMAVSQTWARATDGATVDLHFTLMGAEASPDRLWEALSNETVRFRIEGTDVEALTPPARLMHLALHAAQHGTSARKPLEDLRRALELSEADAWRDAMALAAGVAATPAFGTGLRLVPEGARLAEKLGLPLDRPPAVALRAGSPPPGALTLEAFANAPRLRQKLQLVIRKAVPSRRYMRVWIATEGGRRGGVVLAYLHHSVWLLLRAGPAWRAWRRARAGQSP